MNSKQKAVRRKHLKSRKHRKAKALANYAAGEDLRKERAKIKKTKPKPNLQRMPASLCLTLTPDTDDVPIPSMDAILGEERTAVAKKRKVRKPVPASAAKKSKKKSK